MKAKLFSILFIFFISTSGIYANAISNYFEQFRNTGNADYSARIRIIQNHSTADLLNALEKYYTDSVVSIRRQAYHLIYSKGLQDTDNAQLVVVRLAKGLNDSDSGLRGSIIGHLQEFPLSAFNSEAKSLIASHLNQPNSPHFDRLVLLAGFVGTGQNELLRLSMNEDLPVRRRWNITLALARMGSESALQSAVERVMRAPINSGMVSFLLPDLVYTRQKAALDYAVELLFIDEKLCQTANPDLSGAILCAYPIIELIAPIIVGFPIQIDPRIGIETDDYEKMLQTVRQWFLENPNFEVRKDFF